MKVNFILPSYPSKPGGGTKIMYEYANRLYQNGHSVHVIHSIRRPFKKTKTPVWLRLLIMRIKKKPQWFNFEAGVRVSIVGEVNNRTVPDADATICTWWQMAYAINTLNLSKGKKINLIQDYETWAGQTEKVHKSYSLPVRHVVIARYLSDKVFEHSGVRPVHIPNAIDIKKFSIGIEPEKRNPRTIIMMYSEEPRKGSMFGIDAMNNLKERYPDLQLTLFSVFPKPENLPAWIAFAHRPPDLSYLYNQHAIFISPSLGEGWALPPAEAMACGCAVVCTNIGGHQDYAIEGKTAIMVKPQSPSDLLNAVAKLMTDDTLRISLAHSGNEFIRHQFSWQTSVQKLEEVIMNM